MRPGLARGIVWGLGLSLPLWCALVLALQMLVR